MSGRFTLALPCSRITSRLFGVRALTDAAVRKVVVCEPEDHAFPGPSITVGDQYSKIRGVHEFGAERDDEILKARTPVLHHGETAAYLLRNVFLVNGTLCTYRDFMHLDYGKPGLQPARIEQEFDVAAMCSTAPGNQFFAHFVFDDACTALMGREFAPPVFANAGRPRTPQMLDYFARFGIALNDLPNARFRELWVFADTSLNSHRIERVRSLRRALVTNTPPVRRYCYITRGTTGTARALENEAEVIAALEARGFAIIEPEKLTLAELIAQINGAELAVGVEGSHLIHAVMNLRDGGALLCIQPPTRFNAVYRLFTATAGQHWGFVVAEGGTERFRVDVGELLATIDRAVTSVAAA